MASDREWIELCRNLRISLKAGLPLVGTWKKLGEKGPRSLRLDCQTVYAVLSRGEGIEVAMSLVPHWPPLVRVLLGIAEQTGHLPEICEELTKHFETIKTNRQLFWQMSFWPLLQFGMSICVIGLLILILGFLPNAGGYDPLGLGLKGTSGVLIYFGVVFGMGIGLAVGFYCLKHAFKSGGFDRFLHSIPMIGPMLGAFTLAHFSMALSLLSKTGIGWDKALKLAFDASGNLNWLTKGAKSVTRVRKGKDVSVALAQTGLFNDDFLGRVGVGEESGSLPETLEMIATDAFEEGRIRLRTVATLGAQLLWAATAVIIIFFIFRLFTSYLGQIDRLGI